MRNLPSQAPATCPALRNGHFSGVGIVDPGLCGLAVLDWWHHDAEERNTNGEVGGAGDRVDEPGRRGASECFAPNRLIVCGFLTDHNRACQKVLNLGSEEGLRGNVSGGNKIVWALQADFERLEFVER